MSEHEMNEVCRQQFENFKEKISGIDDRLKTGDEFMRSQGLDIAELKTDIKGITKSLDGVTKALWGMAASILMTLIGFVLSKI